MTPYSGWGRLTPRAINTLFVALSVLVATVSAISVTVIGSPAKILVVVVGLLGVLGTIVQAEIGLLALVFMTYTRFSDVLVHYHGAPSTAKLFVALLVGAILIRWILYGQQPKGWQRPVALVTLYGLVGFSSLLYADDFARALGAVEDYIKDAIIAVIIAILMQRAVTMRRVIWALMATGIFMGTISVHQYLFDAFDNNYWGFGQAALMHIIGESNDYRISGPVGDPNFFAQILLVLVPLSLDRMWSEGRPALRLLAAWALAVSILTILFTFSRGAFLALVVVLALTFVRRPPRPIVLFLTLAITFPLLQFIPAGYTDRLRTLTEALPVIGGGDARTEVSFRGRTSELTVAWLMFMEHPIMGVGLDNYPYHYQRYSRQVGLDPRREARAPHSFYLQVAAESGLMGLTILWIILWVMLRRLGRAERDFLEAGMRNSAAMTAAFTIGVIGYLTGAVFLHAAYPRYFWLLFGIGLAIPQVAQNELRLVRQEEEEEERMRRNRLIDQRLAQQKEEDD